MGKVDSDTFASSLLPDKSWSCCSNHQLPRLRPCTPDPRAGTPCWLLQNSQNNRPQSETKCACDPLPAGQVFLTGARMAIICAASLAFVHKRAGRWAIPSAPADVRGPTGAVRRWGRRRHRARCCESVVWQARTNGKQARMSRAMHGTMSLPSQPHQSRWRMSTQTTECTCPRSCRRRFVLQPHTVEDQENRKSRLFLPYGSPHQLGAAL